MIRRRSLPMANNWFSSVRAAAEREAEKWDWVGEKRQGIQFTTLSAEAQQSIRKYIAEVEKD